MPIRFWHGDADHLVPLAHARHQARLIPGATLSVRHGESHLGGLAAAEEILESIRPSGRMTPQRAAAAPPRRAHNGGVALTAFIALRVRREH